MVRNYIRKTTKGADGSRYSSLDLENAIRDVTNNERKLCTAAKHYNIPRTTLRHHVLGTRGQGTISKQGKGGGGKSSIPWEDEKKLAECITTMEKWGFGLSRTELLDVVQNYVITNNLKTRFKNGRPQEDWFLSFKKRHNLSVKKPQGIEYVRTDQNNPFIINSFYDVLTKTVEELNLTNRPDLIFNLDETSFSNDPSKTKVVGKKGTKSTRVISSAGRENTSVLICSSASGQKIPPLVIFKGKNVIESWVNENDHYETTYEASKRGWMDSEIFYNWFRKVFLKYIPENSNSLLIFDGHASHINYNLAKLATEHNVTILKLPPHSTHLLQPLDVSVFKPFKNNWDKELVKWQRENPRKRLPKKEFSMILNKVYHGLDQSIIINGFKKTGIYDRDQVSSEGCCVNRKAIPNSSYRPADYSRYLHSKASTGTEKQAVDHVTAETDISLPPTHDDDQAYLINTQSETENDNELTEDAPLSEFENSISTSLVACPPKNVTKDDGNRKLVAKSANRQESLEYTKSYSEKESDSKSSFEDILLNMVGKNQKGSTHTTKKRRICPGAEIITSKESLEKLKSKEDEVNRKTSANKDIRKRAKKRNQTKKKKSHLTSSSESDEEVEKLTVDSSDENFIEDINKDSDGCLIVPSSSLSSVQKINSNMHMEDTSNSEEENIPLAELASRPVSCSAIEKDVFLLVSFSGYKKMNYKYVCIVESKEDINNITVIGLRAVDHGKQDFKIKMSNVSCITMDMIAKILPNPKTIYRGRQILYRFPSTVAVSEM